MAPSILYLIIAKTKEICILMKITQNVWRMEMRLSFRKSTWIWPGWNIRWTFYFISRISWIVRLRVNCLLENAENKFKMLKSVYFFEDRRKCNALDGFPWLDETVKGSREQECRLFLCQLWVFCFVLFPLQITMQNKLISSILLNWVKMP